MPDETIAVANEVTVTGDVAAEGVAVIVLRFFMDTVEVAKIGLKRETAAKMADGILDISHEMLLHGLINEP